MRYTIIATYRDRTITYRPRTGTLADGLERAYLRLVRGYPRLASATQWFPPCQPVPVGVGTWHLYGGQYVPSYHATAIGPRVIAHVDAV